MHLKGTEVSIEEAVVLLLDLGLILDLLDITVKCVGLVHLALSQLILRNGLNIGSCLLERRALHFGSVGDVLQQKSSIWSLVGILFHQIPDQLSEKRLLDLVFGLEVSEVANEGIIVELAVLLVAVLDGLIISRSQNTRSEREEVIFPGTHFLLLVFSLQFVIQLRGHEQVVVVDQVVELDPFEVVLVVEILNQHEINVIFVLSNEHGLNVAVSLVVLMQVIESNERVHSSFLQHIALHCLSFLFVHHGKLVQV